MAPQFGTPVPKHGNARPALNFFAGVAPQFRPQEKCGTPVPQTAKIWHLSSTNKIKVAPQFR